MSICCKNIVQVVTNTSANKSTIFVNGIKTKTEEIARYVLQVELKMEGLSNAMNAMNGFVQKLLNYIKEIIDQHIHAFA